MHSIQSVSLLVLIVANNVFTDDNLHIAGLKEIKTTLKGENYDKDIRPYLGENKSVEVKISSHALYLELKSEYKELWSDIFFRQQWADPRLANPERGVIVVGGQALADLMWTPDTFFANYGTVWHVKTPTPNTFIKVEPNGTVLFSQRFKHNFKCKAERAILDCTINVESYGYDINNIIYKPKRTEGSLTLAEVIYPGTGYRLANYTMLENVKNSTTGQYSRLELKFLFYKLS